MTHANNAVGLAVEISFFDPKFRSLSTRSCQHLSLTTANSPRPAGSSPSTKVRPMTRRQRLKTLKKSTTQTPAHTVGRSPPSGSRFEIGNPRGLQEISSALGSPGIRDRTSHHDRHLDNGAPGDQTDWSYDRLVLSEFQDYQAQMRSLEDLAGFQISKREPDRR